MREIEYPYIGKSKLECVVLFFSKGTGFCLESGVNESGYKKIHPDLNKTSSRWIEDNFKNITREYLKNTWGVVESPEHAEFIRELAEVNGIPILYSKEAIEGKEVLFFECSYVFLKLWSDGCVDKYLKKITIPMPPKSDDKSGVMSGVMSDAKSDAEKESPEPCEWPMVGDEVVLNDKHRIKLSTRASNHIGCKGVLRARFENNENEDVYVIEFSNLDCICVFLESIEKPKTPEQELREDLSSIIRNRLSISHAVENIISKYNITKKHP